MADSAEWPCGADATKYAGELAGGHMVECVVIGLDKYRRCSAPAACSMRKASPSGRP
jgi:hypothetical protein